MKPYYQDDAITIWHADYREILPDLPKVDLVLTDPPYVGLSEQTEYMALGGIGKHYTMSRKIGDEWRADYEWLVPVWDKARLGMMVFCSYHQVDEIPSRIPNARKIGLVTWFQRNARPPLRNVPHHQTEFIWLLGKESGLKWGNLRTHYDIPRLAAGCMADPERFLDEQKCVVHPSQKPEALLGELLLVEPKTVLDPFLGTGTTAFAAKKLGCKCVGIEIEEKYCEIAARRCSQTTMELPVSKPMQESEQQALL